MQGESPSRPFSHMYKFVLYFTTAAKQQFIHINTIIIYFHIFICIHVYQQCKKKSGAAEPFFSGFFWVTDSDLSKLWLTGWLIRLLVHPLSIHWLIMVDTMIHWIHGEIIIDSSSHHHRRHHSEHRQVGSESWLNWLLLIMQTYWQVRYEQDWRAFMVWFERKFDSFLYRFLLRLSSKFDRTEIDARLGEIFLARFFLELSTFFWRKRQAA